MIYLRKPNIMKITIFTFLFFFLFSTLKAQCPEGIFFQTQSQIDQFIIDYPNCENLNGDLGVIAISAIHNLDGLQNLKSISGEVRLEFGNNYTSNININGLSNLEFIGSHFIIRNSSIPSVSNLFNNLETIGGILRIENNFYLRDFSGFNALINCGNIEILDNNKLLNLSGFNSIQNIDGYIWLRFNSPFDGETMEITGFQNLHSLSRSLTISDPGNPVIINAFENLEELGTGLHLDYISDNIDSFNSLRHLNIYGAYISVLGLLNVLPLENLTTVIDKITLIASDMTSLWGLENTNQFTDLEIKYNQNLSYCSLPNICTYLQNGGLAEISNNTAGCNSIQEVLDNCNMSIDSHELNSKIEVYPNPVKNDLNISLKDNDLKINKISLYDLSGKLIIEFKNQQKLNLSFYPNGNYVIVIDTDKGFISKKITIAK